MHLLQLRLGRLRPGPHARLRRPPLRGDRIGSRHEHRTSQPTCRRRSTRSTSAAARPACSQPGDVRHIFCGLAPAVHLRLRPRDHGRVRSRPARPRHPGRASARGREPPQLRSSKLCRSQRAPQSAACTRPSSAWLRSSASVRAGVSNLSLDLIAGLPHQTEGSWRRRLSRLSRPVSRTSASTCSRSTTTRAWAGKCFAAVIVTVRRLVPSDDDSVRLYEMACDLLEGAGIEQYEISNFARPGFASRHNLKYWERKPTLASAWMPIPCCAHGQAAFASRTPTSRHLPRTPGPGRARSNVLGTARDQRADFINGEQAFEEALFLGLRINKGLSLDELAAGVWPGVRRQYSSRPDRVGR